MRKQVCGVKSSRSPRISVGSFAEFIFNEVALSHALVLARFSGNLPRILRGHGNAPPRTVLRSFPSDVRRHSRHRSETRVAEEEVRQRNITMKGVRVASVLFPFSEKSLFRNARQRAGERGSFASFERS